VLFLQSLGKSASCLPRQSSQRPHSFLHDGWGVQRGQAVVSSALAKVQLSTSWMWMSVPLAASTSQQPKQSQPLGVRALQ
jgi:hypothetical protein